MSEESAAKKVAKQERINALLEERKGYVTRELKGRVAEVDAELKTLGHRGQSTTTNVGFAREVPKTERS